MRAQVRIDVGEHLQCPFLDAVSQHLPSSKVQAAIRSARFRGEVGAHERHRREHREGGHLKVVARVERLEVKYQQVQDDLAPWREKSAATAHHDAA
ncbi:hypothetical protein [Streptomyces mirabilis]|uniref:hypothetical protein n=1 Tax=Streptomyces mirabilis TaxID=68239 RepID=UPI0022560E43|nr:hypothetical protein [Streptomyces mirabilis]MCX4426581.1 hypothetical protein [Streptomyces mirabilis]